MGLTLTVGNPSDALTEPFARLVARRLAEVYGPAVVLDSPEPVYLSGELGWSGWGLLQDRAARAVGASSVPHLLSMEAWLGGYIPAPTEPTSFTFKGHPTPLAVASLPALLHELELVGTALGWRTDEANLRVLTTHYDDDEMDIQTFAELLLAGRVAERRRQVLWVVK